MGFPFPDNDDHLSNYADPDPVECCRHEMPVSEHCPQCALAALERFKVQAAQARIEAALEQARRDV